MGPPGCKAHQLVRIDVPGLIDGPVPLAFPLRVRREVAPLFVELVRWLVAERRRLRLPPLSSSGGYALRMQRGSRTACSNHSWGLAGDFNAGANPMQRTLRTDMPPGTSAKARSLGLSWGGDWTSTKDPMHFEFLGTPDDARRRVAELSITTDVAPRPALSVEPEPPAPLPLPRPEVEMFRLLQSVDPGRKMYAVSGSRVIHLTGPQLAAFKAAGLFSNQKDRDGQPIPDDVNDAEVNDIREAFTAALA